MRRLVLFVCVLALPWCVSARAADSWQPIPRQLPPLGIEISAADQSSLLAEVERLEQELASRPAADTPLAADVAIYLKAVRFAGEEQEFYRPQDVATARELLQVAARRLAELYKADSTPPTWATEQGLVVRGYRSAVDDSLQPYALEIPASLDLSVPVPLYVWLHGRNDKLTDLAFISERSKKPGQLRPADAIVLHPFGRSCLGWKSTAEVDVFEAIESVCQRYPIDRDRIILAGFSMGGAGAWHIGAHYADRFAAVHAGAGFVDVARYQRLKPEDYPPLYEQALWGLYDVPKYVRNLFNVPVIAYSGELDKQKDAADFMSEAFRLEGRLLPHAIGPGMAHKYDPAVLQQIMDRLHAAAMQGRNPAPLRVLLQTRTLRYSRMHWVEALQLDEHWRDSRVDAAYTAQRQLEVTTKSIPRLRLTPPRPLDQLTIDGQTLEISDTPIELERRDGAWHVAISDEPSNRLRKRHGLQGPIDDVLLEPFIVVTPTGSSTPELDRWVAYELDHFRRRWKNVYRGTFREVRDVDLQDEAWTRFHLICFGDAASNSVLRKVASQLPLVRREGTWHAGSQQFDAAHHLPLLIYPNPKSPAKYLVVNSGPTHRQAHDRTNSLQNPKLGDWAIVDVREPPTADSPGKIVAAGFFDEFWRFPAGNDALSR